MLALVSFSLLEIVSLYYFFYNHHRPCSDFGFVSHIIFFFSSVDEATLKKRQHGSNQATHLCVVLPIYIVHTRWYCMFIQKYCT